MAKAKKERESPSAFRSRVYDNPKPGHFFCESEHRWYIVIRKDGTGFDLEVCEKNRKDLSNVRRSITSAGGIYHIKGFWHQRPESRNSEEAQTEARYQREQHDAHQSRQSHQSKDSSDQPADDIEFD